MQCSWWHDGHGGKRARFHDEVPLSLSHPSSVHRARTNPHPQRTPLLARLVLDGRRGLPPGVWCPTGHRRQGSQRDRSRRAFAHVLRLPHRVRSARTRPRGDPRKTWNGHDERHRRTQTLRGRQRTRAPVVRRQGNPHGPHRRTLHGRRLEGAPTNVTFPRIRAEKRERSIAKRRAERDGDVGWRPASQNPKGTEPLCGT